MVLAVVCCRRFSRSVATLVGQPVRRSSCTATATSSSQDQQQQQPRQASSLLIPVTVRRLPSLKQASSGHRPQPTLEPAARTTEFSRRRLEQVNARPDRPLASAPKQVNIQGVSSLVYFCFTDRRLLCLIQAAPTKRRPPALEPPMDERDVRPSPLTSLGEGQLTSLLFVPSCRLLSLPRCSRRAGWLFVWLPLRALPPFHFCRADVPSTRLQTARKKKDLRKYEVGCAPSIFHGRVQNCTDLEVGFPGCLLAQLLGTWASPQLASRTSPNSSS
jgi:hypothetical protein